MIYPISNELELSILEVNTGKKLEELTINIELNFLKHKFKDIYSIKLLNFNSYIDDSINNNHKKYNYFYQHYLAATFFHKDGIKVKSIEQICQQIKNKITDFYTSPLLSEEMSKELSIAIKEKKTYSEKIVYPLRNFSLQMDNVALYQGDYLENLSYFVMTDYMNRDDTITNLLYAYEISSNGKKSLIKDLSSFKPKQADFFEIYFFAKISFKETVKDPSADIYIGITFISLTKFLDNPDNFLYSLEFIPEVYKLRNFFAAKIYNYSEAEELIKRVVATLTEAVPAIFLAERLKSSFDVYSSDPLNL
jgi:hypothetical protein